MSLLPPHVRGRSTRWTLVAALALAGCVPDDPLRGQEPSLRLTFLDVGQGDAILVQAAEGQTALIDAGPGVSLLPMLRELGVDRIELLVATHPHADHIGGMSQIIESIPVDYYLDSGQPHTTATYAQLMSTLTRHTEITYLEAVPRRLALGSAQIDVLPLPSAEIADLNNRSVGLVIRYGAFAALLSGDSEREELSHFVRLEAVPDVTVLKAPHHGSDNGVTTEFLQRAQPEVVVISVGANSYGHPRVEALVAYSTIAEHVLRTDQLGSIVIDGFEDGRFEVRSATMSLAGVARPRTVLGPPQPPQAAPTNPAVTHLPEGSQGLAISVFADAPGNDHLNPNGEYAVIANRLSHPVNIGGWRLCDAARHCFRFPDGAVVGGHSQVTLFTGPGIHDGTHFYMGYRQAVWNNDGDVATLQDAAGTLIISYRYD